MSSGYQSQYTTRPGERWRKRASQTTQRLLARLYLEGVATGDFEPVFRELVGETTALSANTVERLRSRWRALNGGENLMALVLEGAVFKDGIRQAKESGLRVTTAA